MCGRANFLLPTHLLLHTPLLLLLLTSLTAAESSFSYENTMNQMTMLHPDTPLYLEIAVFVDPFLFTHMKEYRFRVNTEREVRRVVRATIKAMELLYQDPSLGRQFSFVVKRIEILDDSSTLNISNNITQYLDNFCKWQSKLKLTESQKWDHGLLLTGVELEPYRNVNALGLAHFGGMCTENRSCSIIDGRHFGSFYRIARGIGHNLGMYRDVPDTGEPSVMSFDVVSPTLRGGNISWSTNSRNDLERFLRTSQAECLFNVPESSPPDLDHNAEALLQGERFDAYQQYAEAPLYLEIAVFVDPILFTHMKENHYSMETDDTAERNVRSVVLAIIKAVELLYQDPSLGRQFIFVVKRIEILDDSSTLNISNNITQYLDNFCEWQSKINVSESQKWDHAVLLTKLEATSVNLGLGRMEGICIEKHCCSIGEGGHFGGVYIMAHEIGHSFGMGHDDTNEPYDEFSHIMSDTLRGGNINWSAKSSNELEVFLRTSRAACLFNIPELAPPDLDQNAENLLPGEIFDADRQCIFKFGPESHANYAQGLCRHLHCIKNGLPNPSDHAALPGTECAPSQWCWRGECIDKRRFKREVNDISVEDGWSSWTECASACLRPSPGHPHSGSVGISYSTQKCNGQRRKSGPQPCLGSRRSYQVCNTSKCANVPPKSIQNYANDVCSCASGMDDTLTGGGSQRISSDPIEACTVWCSQKSGGSKSHGWRYPDGTACLTKDYNWKRPSYCIDGACQDFGEGGLLLEPYQWLQYSELLQYPEWLQHPEWQINLCGLLHRRVERSLLLSPVQVNASIDSNSHSAPIKHLDFNDESQIKQP